MVEFDWSSVAIAIVGLASAGLTVWGTAHASMRSKVKETVWRELFQNKRNHFRLIGEGIGRVNILLNHLRNLAESADHQVRRRHATMLEIIQERLRSAHGDPTKELRRSNLQKRLASSGGDKPDVLVAVADLLRQDLSAELVVEGMRLRQECLRARMVSFDPPVFDALSEATRDVVNEATHAESRATNFKAIDDRWLPARRKILDEMRLDMHYSAKSFRRVTRVKPSWKQEYIQNAKIAAASSQVRQLQPTPAAGQR